MVGLDHQQVTAADVPPHRLRHVPQVGDQPHLNALGAEAKRDRVDGVVGDREAVDFDVPYGEAPPGFKVLELWFHAVPIESVIGQRGDVDRRLQPLGKLRQAGNVVGMLVGNQDGVDPLRILADRFQALAGLAKAEADVHQQAHLFGGDQSRVAAAAAAQLANSKTRNTLLPAAGKRNRGSL